MPEVPKEEPRPPPVIQSPVPEIPEELPPAIPAKSPKRQKKTKTASDILRLLEEDPFNSVSTVSKSNSKRKTKSKDVVTPVREERPTQPSRAQTTPNRSIVSLVKEVFSPAVTPERSIASPIQESLAPVVTPERSIVSPVKESPVPAVTPHRNIVSPLKESSAPAASIQTSSMSSSDASVKSPASSKASSKLSAVRGGRIDKASKRLSADSSIGTALFDLDELYSFATPAPRIAEGELQPESGLTPETQLPLRREKKGETMSMLLHSGFFPVDSLNGKINANIQLNLKVPPPLSFIHKDLPATPSSTGRTPIELLGSHPGPKSPPGALRHSVRSPRKPSNRRRSPLSQLTANNAKANNAFMARGEEISPSRLSAIPENSASKENSPPSSEAATPVATQIHLRGGSVVTVCPPELTAWQRSIYVQGPIKLPKPVIVPRKNSVASLEPFQEAIDQVYQDALNIPRRRSDEQVVDDVCEFFDDFGFDPVGFVGDYIVAVDIQDSETKELADMLDGEIERFSTPPAEPDVSPLEKVVAQEVVELVSKPPPAPIPRAPKNDMESLRTRGIAYLAHRISHPPANSHVRKEWLTLIPEEPIPESTRAGNNDRNQRMPEVKSSFGPVEVDELDGASSWLGLGIPGLYRSNSKASRAQTLALSATM